MRGHVNSLTLAITFALGMSSAFMTSLDAQFAPTNSQVPDASTGGTTATTSLRGTAQSARSSTSSIIRASESLAPKTTTQPSAPSYASSSHTAPSSSASASTAIPEAGSSASQMSAPVDYNSATGAQAVSGSATSTGPATVTITMTTTPSTTVATASAPSFVPCAVTEVYTGPMRTFTARTAVCVCSGSTFAQSLYSTGTDVLPCAYTAMPTSSLALQLAPAAAASDVISASTQAASSQPTTLATQPSTTSRVSSPASGQPLSATYTGSSFYPCRWNMQQTGIGVQQTTPICVCDGKTFAVSRLITNGVTTACAYTTSPTAVLSLGSPLATTAQTLFSSAAQQSVQVAASAIMAGIQGAQTLPSVPKPTSNGIFYVYSAKWCNNFATPDCAEAEGKVHVGLVRMDQAGCDFFDADGRDGFHRFLGAANRYGTEAFQDFANVVIHNGAGECKLGNVTFEKTQYVPIIGDNSMMADGQRRTEGMYIAKSEGKEGSSTCSTQCKWPGLQSKEQVCDKPEHDRQVQCLLSCVGDFCTQRDLPENASPIPLPRPSRKAKRSATTVSSDPSPSAPQAAEPIVVRAPQDLAVLSIFSDATRLQTSSTAASQTIQVIAAAPAASEVSLRGIPSSGDADCTEQLGREPPKGTAVVYIWTAQYCSLIAAGACDDPNALGIMGMASAADASCAWFSKAAPEDGASIFYYADENWQRQNSYPNHVFPASPEGLRIANGNHYCGLNDVRFEKRCDGTYLATNNGRSERAICRRNCQWPQQSSDTIRCDNPGLFSVQPTCFMECIGDMCAASQAA